MLSPVFKLHCHIYNSIFSLCIWRYCWPIHPHAHVVCQCVHVCVCVCVCVCACVCVCVCVRERAAGGVLSWWACHSWLCHCGASLQNWRQSYKSSYTSVNTQWRQAFLTISHTQRLMGKAISSLCGSTGQLEWYSATGFQEWVESV